jgi:uncharacterized membrane protein YGL010W
MANSLFNRQLSVYAAVHRDMRNRATHFVGIPVIAFSLLLALTPWRVLIAGREVSMTMILAVLAVLGWLALDFGIGVVLAVVMLLAWYLAEALASALGDSGAWGASAGLFVGGWAIQLLGHRYEGKRPALLDNVFQAFIGPMFLVAEVMIEMGHRRDLANVIGEGWGDGDVTAR